MVLADPVQGGWSRRALLGFAGGVGASSVLAGCSWFGDEPPDPPPPDPLEPLLASTRALAGWYQRVLDAHSGLADQLGPLHQAHLAHEEALLAMIGRPELATPSPGAGSWAPPLDQNPVPDQPADAIAELREAGQAAQEEAAQACLAAAPERAAQLGSITAARATHAEVLR